MIGGFRARTPRISVGVPAYKGGAFIGATLSSIYAQTYANFDVLVSVDGDDAETYEACRPFFGAPRFRIERQRDRLGWAGNTNWLMANTTGDLFSFYQQDDLTDPSFFAALVEELRLHSDAAAAYADVRWFGDKQELTVHPAMTDGPVERVADQIGKLHWAAFHGLIRRAALRRAGPLRVAAHESGMEDIVFTAKLVAIGTLRRVPLPLYHKRMHARNTHSGWLEADMAKRREVWINLCIGLIEAAALATRSQEKQLYLLRRALERFVTEVEGRWMLFSPGRDEAGRWRLYRDILDRLAGASRSAAGGRLARALDPRERAWKQMLELVEELRALR